jgi:hypothetical protein
MGVLSMLMRAQMVTRTHDEPAGGGPAVGPEHMVEDAFDRPQRSPWQSIDLRGGQHGRRVRGIHVVNRFAAAIVSSGAE